MAKDEFLMFRRIPDELITKLDYNYETGELSRNGKLAGCLIKATGYVMVRHKNYLYMAHRIAWRMYYGEEAPRLDHIDRDKANNAINNLRKISHTANLHNVGKQNNNKSGYLGVSKTATGKWIARMTRYGKRHNLGVHTTPELANEAVQSFLESKTQ